MATTVAERKLFVAGEWLETGAWIDIRSPYSGEVVGRVAKGGAEETRRAIAAAEERRLAETWRGAVRPTRFAARCGTNFAALVFPIALALQRVWPFAPTVYASAAVVILSLALTMELWLAVEASTKRFARAFLLPGLGLQRITTREPRLEETRVALRAVESVLSRELAA